MLQWIFYVFMSYKQRKRFHLWTICQFIVMIVMIEGLINVMSFEYVYRMSNKQLERKWEVINPQGFIIISWTSILRDFMTGLIQKFKYTLKSKPDNNLFGKSIVQNFYRSLKLRIVINVWKLISTNFQWNLGNENFTCLTNRFI